MLIRASSGQIETTLLLICVLAIALTGAVTDLLFGKIFNWLTLPALLTGLAASACFGGWGGLTSALFAIGAGLALYGWMFVLGAMGGGDVKFLMALGAWGGLHFVVKTALLGVAIGGLFSLGMLLYRRRLLDFLKRLKHFLLTVVHPELEVEKPKIDHSITMPFGLPIAIAAAWVALGHPFELMGMSLWSR